MLQRVTGHTCCAYCGMDLAKTYERWLLINIDHVVPLEAGKEKGISIEWLEDRSNLVLACSACNTFRNRTKVSLDEECPATLNAFYELRDRMFIERKEKILECHDEERQFYGKKSWTVPVS